MIYKFYWALHPTPHKYYRLIDWHGTSPLLLPSAWMSSEPAQTSWEQEEQHSRHSWPPQGYWHSASIPPPSWSVMRLSGELRNAALQCMCCVTVCEPGLVVTQMSRWVSCKISAIHLVYSPGLDKEFGGQIIFLEWVASSPEYLSIPEEISKPSSNVHNLMFIMPGL